MPSIIRSEFTKFLTLPSVWIVTGIPLVLFLYLQYLAFDDTLLMIANVGTDGMADTGFGPVNVESEIWYNVGVSIFNAGILFPILGAVIAGSEFRTGQLGMSLVAVPARTRFVAGKFLATAIYALAFGVFCMIVETASISFAVRDWNAQLLLTPELLVIHGRLLLFIVAATFLGVAVTLIARRTLTGIIISVILIMLTMSQVVAMVAPAVDALLPFSAARNMLLDDLNPSPPTTGSATLGAIVLIAWGATAVIAATIALRRRDAR